MASRHTGIGSTASPSAFFSPGYYQPYVKMDPSAAAAAAATVQRSQPMQSQPLSSQAHIQHQRPQPHSQTMPHHCASPDRQHQQQQQQQQQETSTATPKPAKGKRGRPRLNLTPEERAERTKKQQAAWRAEKKRRRQEKEANTKARHKDISEEGPLPPQPPTPQQQQSTKNVMYPSQVGGAGGVGGTQPPFFVGPTGASQGRGEPFISVFNGMSNANNSLSSLSQHQQQPHQPLHQCASASQLAIGNPASLAQQHLRHARQQQQQQQQQQQPADDSSESLPPWKDIDVMLTVSGDLAVRTEVAEMSWRAKVPGRLKVSFVPEDAAAAVTAPSGRTSDANSGAGSGIAGAGRPSPGSWRSVNSSE